MLLKGGESVANSLPIFRFSFYIKLIKLYWKIVHKILSNLVQNEITKATQQQSRNQGKSFEFRVSYSVLKMITYRNSFKYVKIMFLGWNLNASYSCTYGVRTLSFS